LVIPKSSLGRLVLMLLLPASDQLAWRAAQGSASAETDVKQRVERIGTPPSGASPEAHKPNGARSATNKTHIWIAGTVVALGLGGVAAWLVPWPPMNEFIATIVVLASSVLLISFWKQILFILLFGLALVLGFGLYNVATAMGH
jgi:hypothetical protein